MNRATSHQLIQKQQTALEKGRGTMESLEKKAVVMRAAGEVHRMMGMTGMVKVREMGMEMVREKGRMMRRKRETNVYL